MQANLHCVGVVPQGKHTVFVDTKAEAESFDPIAYFDTVPELVDKPHRRLRKEQLKEPIIVAGVKRKAELAQAETEMKKQYRELQARIQRRDKITKWEQKLELKHKLMVREEPHR